MPVLPLWDHVYDKENLYNLVRIASVLKNNYTLIKNLTKSNDNNVIIGWGKRNEQFKLCSGTQCFINIRFLELLEQKYKISNLINVIRNRSDRCGLERIMGLLFYQEYIHFSNKTSLFGNIFTHPYAFKYTYEKYTNDLKKKRVANIFVKVWTGR